MSRPAQSYRMDWPILDGRMPFMDLIGLGSQDLARVLAGRGWRPAGPVDWSLPFLRGRRHLRAVVEVAPTKAASA